MDFRFIFTFVVAGCFLTTFAQPAPMSEEDSERFNKIATPIASDVVITPPDEEALAIRDKGLLKFEKSSELDTEALEFGKLNLSIGGKISYREKQFLGRENWQTMIAMAPGNTGTLLPQVDIDEKLSAYKEEDDVITMEFDGGAYYNEEENLLAAQKNVIIKSLRGSIKCGGQIKLIMKRAELTEEQKKKKEAKEAEQAKKGDAKNRVELPDFENIDYSEVEYMYANGGVTMKRLNKHGLVEAIQGPEIVYDGKTGEALIMGNGKKTVVSDNTRLETESEGSYIRMYADGSVYVQGDTLTKMEVEMDPKKRVKKERKRVEPQVVKDFNIDQVKPDKDLTLLWAKGFAYFNAEKKEVIYEKDIHAEGPDFAMRSDNQLLIKLIISEKPVTEKSDSKKKDEEMIKMPPYESMQFDGIEYAATSGNVVFKRVNADGDIEGAMGPQVTYYGKSGDILMDGSGKKTLLQGENLHEVTGSGSYLRFMGRGKNFSVRINGKNRTVMVAKEREDGKKTFSTMGRKKKN